MLTSQSHSRKIKVHQRISCRVALRRHVTKAAFGFHMQTLTLHRGLCRGPAPASNSPTEFINNRSEPFRR